MWKWLHLMQITNCLNACGLNLDFQHLIYPMQNWTHFTISDFVVDPISMYTWNKYCSPSKLTSICSIVMQRLAITDMNMKLHTHCSQEQTRQAGWLCLQEESASGYRRNRSSSHGRRRYQHMKWQSLGTAQRNRRTWRSWRRRRSCHWTGAHHPSSQPWRRWPTAFGSSRESTRRPETWLQQHLQKRCSCQTWQHTCRSCSWRTWPWSCPWTQSSGPGWGSNECSWQGFLSRMG